MGKTTAYTISTKTFKKHPHAHGEDGNIVMLKYNIGETPPRSWGRPRLELPSRSDTRNTPTLMGKTLK